MVPPIIIFTLDCLRKSTATKTITPFLNSLPVQGSQCYASGTWTLPAHASLFSGKSPIEHGVTRPGDSLNREDAHLPQEAKKGGYETAIFSENPTFSSQTGFDHYIDATHDDIHQKLVPSDFSPFGHVSEISIEGAISLVKAILSQPNRARNTVNTAYSTMLQLRKRTPSYPHHGKRLFSHLCSYLSSCRDPQFIVANLLDPHNPYYGAPPSLNKTRNKSELEALRAGDDNRIFLLTDEKPPNIIQSVYGGWMEFFAAQRSVYEEYARECDRLLAEWRSKKAEVFDDALIVILGDHGQLFGAEEMVGHQTSLHPHGIHVPFAVDPPKDWDTTSRTLESAISTAGVGRALRDVCSGQVDTTKGLIESIQLYSREADGSVLSCADGPTWTVAQLYDDDQFETELIDKLATRKVACIYEDYVDIFQSNWQSNKVNNITYSYTESGRKQQKSKKKSPTDENMLKWLQQRYDYSDEERNSVDAQLEALGYV